MTVVNATVTISGATVASLGQQVTIGTGGSLTFSGSANTINIGSLYMASTAAFTSDGTIQVSNVFDLKAGNNKM